MKRHRPLTDEKAKARNERKRARREALTVLPTEGREKGHSKPKAIPRRDRLRALAKARARKVRREDGASRAMEGFRRKVEVAAEANKAARKRWQHERTEHVYWHRDSVGYPSLRKVIAWTVQRAPGVEARR